MLEIPNGAKKLILFVHGSGSSRFSPRNQFVAKVLNNAGLGTYLFDLLDPDEEERRFDISLLADRTILAIQKMRVYNLPIGLFGASTGAAATLVASAQEEVFAIVSRGGRPDMAVEYCPKVNAPTLLIVGGNDDVVIDMNKEAYEALGCEKKLSIIPGATHLFEEPGTLEVVAKQATNWFLTHS